MDTIGVWLKVNGEAICGTKASPFDKKPEWGYASTGEYRIFLIVDTATQQNAKIVIPEIKGTIKAVWYLPDKKRNGLKIKNINGSNWVLLPEKALKFLFQVIVLEN